MVHATRPEPGTASAVVPLRPGRRFLASLVLITTAGPVSLQIFLPALDAMRSDFGISAALAQLAVSVPLLTFGIAMLVFGPLSDRFGRRGPLMFGGALYLVGNLVCLFAPTIEILIVGRILNAVGGAAGMVVTRAMVRDVYPPEGVAGAISQLTVGQIVPPMLAPAAGGLITDLTGWRGNFVVLVVLGAVVLLLTQRLRETHHERAASGGVFSLLSGFARLLRLRRFNGFTFFAVGAVSAYFAFLAGAPLVAVGGLGLSSSVYGLLFIGVSASFMGGNMVSARVSHRAGHDRMVVIGGSIALTGALAGLALALTGAEGVAALFGPATLVAFGNGLSLNNAQAGVMAVDPRAAGAAAGLMGFLQMAVGAGTTQGMGFIHDGTALPLMALMAASMAVGLAVYAVANIGTGYARIPSR